MSPTIVADVPAAGAPPRVRTEEVRHCPLCSGTRLKAWRTGHDRLHRVSPQRFTYAKCKDCRLVFLSLRPLESAIHHFYPDDYGPYKRRAEGAAAAAAPGRPSLLRRLLVRPLYAALHFLAEQTSRAFPDRLGENYWAFYRPARPGLALLDFGCGSDKFLNQARGLGWDTTGIDFSEQAVEQVRKSGHRGLVMSGGVWDELADGAFGLVRLSHVVEHLYHPREVLAALRRKMSPGATLHVAVPNPSSLTSRLFRSRWFALDCPRHIMLFSPARLKRLLADVGFSGFTVLHETVTKDFARSLAYLLEDLGRIGHAQVEGFMNRRPLSEALYPLMRLMARLGWADRYHVFARA